MEPYSDIALQQMVDQLLLSMSSRVPSHELDKIQRAYEFAKMAHAPQRRKSGEPYIVHPISVAKIVGEEMKLDTNPVCAAFLHDVVEDTHYTIDDIQQRFGDDVAFLVQVVTKVKKEFYENSKQIDNFRQMLDSIQCDIRALLVKLADRTHNMRTLASMKPEKQMKIAGETDYFYAPLANRLGLYDIKTELENLSFKYRCPIEYARLERLLEKEKKQIRLYLGDFISRVRNTLRIGGIKADVQLLTRSPYGVRKKILSANADFHHLENIHLVKIIYDEPDPAIEKETALKIYSLLTDAFEEKPYSLANYIDHPKENGYQSLHLHLLADNGHWQEVHICSRRMSEVQHLGCIAAKADANISGWIDKLKGTLQDMTLDPGGMTFMEGIKASFYNDDIKVLRIDGTAVTMPKDSTALDFAFEIFGRDALRAQYARINGKLAFLRTKLQRGDLVEIGTDCNMRPTPQWLDYVVSYKAKRLIKEYLMAQPEQAYTLCEHCSPIPGDEVIGFLRDDGTVEVHKRECTKAISMASQQGDAVVAFDFPVSQKVYPVKILIKAVDRYRLLLDIIECITMQLGLSIHSLKTDTTDNIVETQISFGVHSHKELEQVINAIDAIKGVEEVWDC